MRIIPQLLIIGGWGLAGFLSATLLWSGYAESALGGGIVGLATGVAMYRAGLIDEWLHIAFFPLIWVLSALLPHAVYGSEPSISSALSGLAIAGAATGLTLRLIGKDVPWRSLAYTSIACASAPFLAFVACLPLVVVAVLTLKDPPFLLIDAGFGVGGCIAGAIAGRFLLRFYATSSESPTGTTARTHHATYEAFISYRTSPVDTKWAAWLQNELESWQTPALLCRERGCPPKLLPIFRDQADLAASADLPHEIKRALEASKFLIVVCSPRTPHSIWVKQEISHFSEIKGFDRILFLLVEGELSEGLSSYYEVASQAKDLARSEPLAADVRSGTGKPSHRQRRLALLKLLAPILGVGLDDLARRYDARRRTRATLIGAAAAAVIGALGFVDSGRASMAKVAEAKGTAQRAATLLEKRPLCGLLLATYGLQQNVDARTESDPLVLNTMLKAMSRNGGLPLLGHSSAVKALAFSEDEKWLASGDFEGKVGFWNLAGVTPSVTWRQTAQPRILAIDSAKGGSWFAFGAQDLLTLCDLNDALHIDCSTLEQPSGQVFAVAFSPDGQWLASGGDNRQVGLWRKNPQGRYDHFGALAAELQVFKLAWSLNGEWLAASTAFPDLPEERQDRNRIVLWRFSPEPGEPLLLPPSPTNLGLQFSPKGDLLVAGDVMGTLRFWRMANLKKSTAPDATRTTSSSISSLAFGHSGGWLVTGGGDGTVMTWDLGEDLTKGDSSVVNRYFGGRAEQVRALAVSVDDTVAVGSSFPIVWSGPHVIYPQDISPVGGHEKAVSSVAFSPTGAQLATADFDGMVRLWNMHSSLDGGNVWASDETGTMSDDGKWIVTRQQPPRLYAASDGFRQGAPLDGFDERPKELAFSPKSDALIGIGNKGLARVWSLGDHGATRPQPLATVSAEQYSESAATIVFDDSGKLLAIAGDDGRGTVWKRHNDAVSMVGKIDHINPDLFGVYHRPSTKLLDSQILSMSFTDDGKWLATGSSNGSVIVWNLENDSPDSVLRLASHDHFHTGEVAAVKFLKFLDDHVLVSGGADGKLVVRSWIRGSAKVLATHQSFKGWLESLGSDASNRWLIAGGGYIPQPWGSLTTEYDSRVLVWKTGTLTGQPTTLSGLEGDIRSLAFGNDRKYLAAGGANGIRFWDLSGDDPVPLPLALDFSPTELKFTSDGRHLFASGKGSRLWSFDPPELIEHAQALAGRNLTREEWAEFFGETGYQSIFPNLHQHNDPAHR